MNFKHIPANVKLQYPFNSRRIAMLCGGTGITPIAQAIQPILANASDETKIVLLYGSKTEPDILLRETLEKYERDHPDQIKVVHVLSDAASGGSSGWGGETGFITRDLFSRYQPSPSEKFDRVLVCGPPPMYDAVCGPRDQDDVTGWIEELGYGKEEVYKF